ncbi:hypothetical protein K466DRAFT_128759 [Polyporus arcularius HHB13444]|uniref:Uncharacterized protein n=1 Tax=Polyporus arcularius HHB13444 TaxID=1314778 RepID=A0A5C3PCT0_9APHY|nr:hypothetical protein K466DRAFT_128759 [Polyporus arcularius HHB13444]
MPVLPACNRSDRQARGGTATTRQLLARIATTTSSGYPAPCLGLALLRTAPAVRGSSTLDRREPSSPKTPLIWPSCGPALWGQTQQSFPLGCTQDQKALRSDWAGTHDLLWGADHTTPARAPQPVGGGGAGVSTFHATTNWASEASAKIGVDADAEMAPGTRLPLRLRGVDRRRTWRASACQSSVSRFRASTYRLLPSALRSDQHSSPSGIHPSHPLAHLTSLRGQHSPRLPASTRPPSVLA